MLNYFFHTLQRPAIHIALITALTCCLLPSLTAHGQRKKSAEAKAVGLKVGAKAPTFKLKDQNGKTHDLKEMLKKGPVAIIFHRSAAW